MTLVKNVLYSFHITSYDYSSRGELLSVMLPDGTVIDYVHDPLGRRITKKVNGVIAEKYFWQGLTRFLAVYDGSENLLMRFQYADARMPVSMTRSDGTYYLTYDQVGSLRVVSDSSGNAVKVIYYDSFGDIINDSDPSFEVPFGFAGGLHDRDTGLVRFCARYYDPDIDRWTAKDPILFEGNNTDLYGYCLSDPVNWTDPYGVRSCAKIGVGVLSAAKGIGTMALWVGLPIAIGVATHKPLLGLAFVPAMIPVVYAGWIEFEHALHLIEEGWKEPDVTVCPVSATPGPQVGPRILDPFFFLRVIILRRTELFPI